jgi:hypothetical protein
MRVLPCRWRGSFENSRTRPQAIDRAYLVTACNPDTSSDRSDFYRRLASVDPANTTFDAFAGPADSPEVARLPAHLDRRFRCCHNRGVPLEGQPERLPVPATTAFVRVCFSIAAIPQQRHQGEPHGPGATLTRYKWCNWASGEPLPRGEWLQRQWFLSSNRASERGLETLKVLGVGERARVLCAGVSVG